MGSNPTPSAKIIEVIEEFCISSTCVHFNVQRLVVAVCALLAVFLGGLLAFALIGAWIDCKAEGWRE